MTWTDNDRLMMENWIDEHQDQLFAEIEPCQTLGAPDLDDSGIRVHFEDRAAEYWRKAHDRLAADFREVTKRADEAEARLRQQVWISFALGLVLLAVTMCRVWGI